MKEIKYGLKYKKNGNLLGYYTSPNGVGSDFCHEVEYILTETKENTWFVATPEHAEWVRRHSTPWYNALYETPHHEYKAEDLAVVKVEIERVEEEIEVSIPSFEEFARFRSKGNRKNYEFYMWQKEQSPEISYDLYDLQEMIRNKR